MHLSWCQTYISAGGDLDAVIYQVRGGQWVACAAGCEGWWYACRHNGYHASIPELSDKTLSHPHCLALTTDCMHLPTRTLALLVTAPPELCR